ncbi:auxin-induced protein 15A [Ziziphus jujuba]|uniref:Auxin-induced protein 15A n=2 Tax=Ziziphus jujuba TaxID=326968 RepID=A0A6P4AD00_ZIZJJ|nr:auxin-induced protein 15A [Ziziphus jujuba]KAH7517711.1 hypothetical protein FEM48_Zijuj09G0093300 [Ziziphus jujuba var. spinosa]
MLEKHAAPCPLWYTFILKNANIRCRYSSKTLQEIIFVIGNDWFSVIAKSKKHLLESSSTLNQVASKGLDIPKSYFAVYVGESQKKMFVIPVSMSKEPSFQDLLSQAAEEYGYDYPMGGVTISSHENVFLDLVSGLNV